MIDKYKALDEVVEGISPNIYALDFRDLYEEVYTELLRIIDKRDFLLIGEHDEETVWEAIRRASISVDEEELMGLEKEIYHLLNVKIIGMVDDFEKITEENLWDFVQAISEVYLKSKKSNSGVFFIEVLLDGYSYEDKMTHHGYNFHELNGDYSDNYTVRWGFVREPLTNIESREAFFTEMLFFIPIGLSGEYRPKIVSKNLAYGTRNYILLHPSTFKTGKEDYPFMCYVPFRAPLEELFYKFEYEDE